jgi:hypothetical protein
VGGEFLSFLGKWRVLKGVEEDLSVGGREKICNYRWWQAGRYEKASVTKPSKCINIHKVIQVGNTENSHNRFLRLRAFFNV